MAFCHRGFGLYACVDCLCLSDSFETLILWRVVQGFSGGTLIPTVFSAVFLMFPLRLQSVATTIAGVLAVLAPTVGPVVGGWLTGHTGMAVLNQCASGRHGCGRRVRSLPKEKLNLAQARRPRCALVDA